MRILLLTPPFTQINTPYPATAFLKTFLIEHGFKVFQADLGIDTFLSLFSKSGLTKVFEESKKATTLPKKHKRIVNQSVKYLSTIDRVIRFLQNKDLTLGYRICSDDFLPKNHRFDQLISPDEIFGSMSVVDKARFISTIYLEEIADFIKEVIDHDFGFSRYAERLTLSSTNFDRLHDRLSAAEDLIDQFLIKHLNSYLAQQNPELVGISVPFPGCLYGALRAAKCIKQHDSNIQVAIGGGYVSTELRELSEPRVFEFVDYVCLDQGEFSFLQLIKHINRQNDKENLVRSYYLAEGKVRYSEGKKQFEFPNILVGVPDYSDLRLTDYLSVIEIPNPMHRLWNDGRWNKMMLAQGCYWQKCSFCDTSLSYIKDYFPGSAAQIVDKMEEVMAKTGQSGFHFVDEAAPPKLLKELACEILKRNLTVSWWTNIRFEKNYSSDVCKLLSASGCIAVSGGLETVSDRLLEMMNKGVSIQQAIDTLKNFQNAGILVHTYLMYGFPTQTAQETINSLEMVRQLFDQNLIQSCFWHRFALTAHSPMAKNPEKYKISIVGPQKGKFAWNDLEHDDPTGCDHEAFESGLNKAVFNFMYGIGLDYDIGYWFDFETKGATISPELVELLLNQSDKNEKPKMENRLLWLGGKPELIKQPAKKRNKKVKFKLLFQENDKQFDIVESESKCLWIQKILKMLEPGSQKTISVKELADLYEKELDEHFESFLKSDSWRKLKKSRLIAF